MLGDERVVDGHAQVRGLEPDPGGTARRGVRDGGGHDGPLDHQREPGALLGGLRDVAEVRDEPVAALLARDDRGAVGAGEAGQVAHVGRVAHHQDVEPGRGHRLAHLVAAGEDGHATSVATARSASR